jgi:hypothetical protein
MVSLGFCPNWFFQYSIFFELAFAVITLFVALQAFKVYKLSKEKSPMLFGIAFLLLSFSYFIQSALNIGILYKLSQNVNVLHNISQVINLGMNALYTHMIFTLAALVLLVFITLKTKSPKIFILLLTISLLPIYLGRDPVHTFFVLSSIFELFIAYHYLMNYLKNKYIPNFLVFAAFFLLLVSDIHFIFSLNHKIFYVLGHFLELFAYLFILINLVWVLKK